MRGSRGPWFASRRCGCQAWGSTSAARSSTSSAWRTTARSASARCRRASTRASSPTRSTASASLPSALDLLAIGTTTGTNALIERKGARTALVTTRGFRDVLELRRTNKGDLYDLQWDPPTPLVPRCDRLEITERISWRGEIVTPLAEDEVDRLVRIVQKRGIEAVAIVFLHSYVDGRHERRLRDLLRERLPELEIAISCEILPMYREFERSTTVVANAYLAPVMRRWFRGLRAELEQRGYASEPLVMQSNGGLASMHGAAEIPAKLIRSGPSAGAVALEGLSRQLDAPNVIGLDIGGTSADVALVWQGRSTLSDRNVPEWGLPVVLPSLDIISIGAGGGSIARIDEGGALRVGPESAGASPGPACYGRGGVHPTSTDAQLVLGRLGTELVGGELGIDVELAERAIRLDVAEPLGLSVVDAAAGILRILTDTMMRAVRLVTIERGYDPRDFVLCGFGGGGPMYAVDIARELSVPRVVVPRFPGVFSAYGLMQADVVYDAMRTVLREVGPGDVDGVEAVLQELEATVLEQYARDGTPRERVRFRRIAEMLYSKQMHELPIELAAGPFDAAALERAVADFHREHGRLHGHSEPSDPVTFVNLKVLGERLRETPFAPPAPDPFVAETWAHRPVYFTGHGFVETVVVPRSSLAVGASLDGPALITQKDTTTVLPPGAEARVVETGDILIEVGVGG
ncbi:MAG: hydantoinase/oxoprolinase family protein [Thermoleophilia bacterium]